MKYRKLSTFVLLLIMFQFSKKSIKHFCAQTFSTRSLVRLVLKQLVLPYIFNLGKGRFLVRLCWVWSAENLFQLVVGKTLEVGLQACRLPQGALVWSPVRPPPKPSDGAAAASVSRPGASNTLIHRRKHQVVQQPQQSLKSHNSCTELDNPSEAQFQARNLTGQKLICRKK